MDRKGHGIAPLSTIRVCGVVFFGSVHFSGCKNQTLSAQTRFRVSKSRHAFSDRHPRIWSGLLSLKMTPGGCFGAPCQVNSKDLTRSHPKWWFMWGIAPPTTLFQVGEILQTQKNVTEPSHRAQRTGSLRNALRQDVFLAITVGEGLITEERLAEVLQSPKAAGGPF